MDEFNTIDGAANSPVAPASQPKGETSKPKPKRAARPKAKKRPTVADLPDLSNFASVFGSVHWLTDTTKQGWAEALSKSNENGFAIIMEGSEIKGVLLPFETYNDLLASSAKNTDAD